MAYDQSLCRPFHHLFSWAFWAVDDQCLLCRPFHHLFSWAFSEVGDRPHRHSQEVDPVFAVVAFLYLDHHADALGPYLDHLHPLRRFLPLLASPHSEPV